MRREELVVLSSAPQAVYAGGFSFWAEAFRGRGLWRRAKNAEKCFCDTLRTENAGSDNLGCNNLSGRKGKLFERRGRKASGAKTQIRVKPAGPPFP
jgi:hypothetical protein